jgi:hypothetical protein
MDINAKEKKIPINAPSILQIILCSPEPPKAQALSLSQFFLNLRL